VAIAQSSFVQPASGGDPGRMIPPTLATGEQPAAARITATVC